ncbi:MAG: hypothetical protein B7Z68_11800 [Acidobacteria bacterium 21-70-11]|nr:MAG: hypothetical protein B7Z68_11800 [Acidobacteria bacterium 21-70-11]
MQRALDSAPAVIASVQALAVELRDQRLPALSARTDALVERLHEELTEAAGLAERVARHEPLHIAVEPAVEARIPAAVAAASRSFADEFRGDRGEILDRAADHVRLLGGAAPVLDVGCGRGELLEGLRDAGVEARGVDADPAMVAVCRRLGLAADEGDALAALREAPPGSLGAVTAVHIVEHLPAAGWMALVEGAAAALRPGGVLLIESPNPESLRVGAGLFWLDPTHRAPVHPEALAFVVKALGLEVVETRFLHPFPPDQALATPSQPEAVRELAARLDGRGGAASRRALRCAGSHPHIAYGYAPVRPACAPCDRPNGGGAAARPKLRGPAFGGESVFEGGARGCAACGRRSRC